MLKQNMDQLLTNAEFASSELTMPKKHTVIVSRVNH